MLCAVSIMAFSGITADISDVVELDRSEKTRSVLFPSLPHIDQDLFYSPCIFSLAHYNDVKVCFVYLRRVILRMCGVVVFACDFVLT